MYILFLLLSFWVERSLDELLTGNMNGHRVEKTTELLKKHEEAKSLLYSLDALARFWRAL